MPACTCTSYFTALEWCGSAEALGPLRCYSRTDRQSALRLKPRNPAALSLHNAFVNLFLNSYFIEYVFGIFVILLWRMTLIFSCLKSELISVNLSRSHQNHSWPKVKMITSLLHNTAPPPNSPNMEAEYEIRVVFHVWFPPSLIVTFRSSARCLDVLC